MGAVDAADAVDLAEFSTSETSRLGVRGFEPSIAFDDGEFKRAVSRPYPEPTPPDRRAKASFVMFVLRN